MANTNAPFGLVPRRLRNGAPWVGPLKMYYHDSGDGTALFPGDPFIIAGGADSRGVPKAIRATAGATNRITGVVCGIVPFEPFGNQYGAGSTAYYFLGCDDPTALFAAQEDSDGGALTADNVGENIDLASGSGNTATGVSGFTLDSSTVGTGATKQLRIVELLNDPGNEIGDYAKWLVAINLPTETGAAGSTGV
jgi:hypothetical protein